MSINDTLRMESFSIFIWKLLKKILFIKCLVCMFLSCHVRILEWIHIL